MDQVYLKIWQLAKPYYKKGRVYDIDQINWMMPMANTIAGKEGLNKKILIPLVILHDVGWSKVGELSPNIKDKETKKIHMKASAQIAQEILENVEYDKKLTKKIVYYISVHDNWVLGDNKPFEESKEMAFFNDLDFLYVTSSFQTFKTMGESMSMNPKEFYQFWQNDEKLVNRPFCCEETGKMFEESMRKIKKEINSYEKQSENQSFSHRHPQPREKGKI